MFHLARAGTPECQGESVGSIVWRWCRLQREELRNCLRYCRLGCATFTGNGALHFGWRGFDHFNLVIGGNQQGNPTNGANRHR